MEEEIMSGWIVAKVPEEQERLQRVNAFRKATERFLAILEDQVNTAIAEYTKHFPDVQFEVKRNRVEIRVIRRPERTHGEQGSRGLSVRAFGDPIAQAFVFDVHPSERLNKAIPASVQDESLVLDITAHGISNDNLVEYMLMPILFPGLVNDAGVLGYLQEQFGPR